MLIWFVFHGMMVQILFIYLFIQIVSGVLRRHDEFGHEFCVQRVRYHAQFTVRTRGTGSVRYTRILRILGFWGFTISFISCIFDGFCLNNLEDENMYVCWKHGYIIDRYIISQSRFDVIFSLGCYAVRQTLDPGTNNLSLVFVKLIEVKGVN